MTKNVQQLDRVVIRIAGDSGDGMQLTGDRFPQETAMFGNDLATFPDFPAEIRAPAGTLPGVSGFQINFSSRDVYTPGDAVDVLTVASRSAMLGEMVTVHLIVLDHDDLRGALKPDARGRSQRGDLVALRALLQP